VASRLISLLPRLIALEAILLLASATMSFAADNALLRPKPDPEPVEPAPTLLTVPDVRGQAYVFAKSTLEERGFAWRVAGSVQGYPANLVMRQSPAPRTRVVDTGQPTIVLGLARNDEYAQEGMPENASPYLGTAVKLLVRPKARTAQKPAARPHAAPRRKANARPKARPQAGSKGRTKVRPKAKPTPKATPEGRPPAFVVPGAPKEPVYEMPLPERARRLEAWLRTNPTRTDANVHHWLYQHAWIVTGAKFGWWHGAEALEILVRIDEEVQRRWGLGAKSEAAARRALAAVRAKSR
jgi:hypothetical protein